MRSLVALVLLLVPFLAGKFVRVLYYYVLYHKNVCTLPVVVVVVVTVVFYFLPFIFSVLNEDKAKLCCRVYTCATKSNNTITFFPTAAQPCTNGTVRLVDGPVESAGRVEICIHGVWGRVCGGNQFGLYHSRVVCRQLGYNVDAGGELNHALRKRIGDVARS